jgi:hypothetical protein
MAYLTTEQKVILPRPRKRFGFSHSFGTAFFGYTRFAEFNDYAGIYQYRNSFGQKKHVKTIMYWPRNPQTPTQQAWRSVFADGAAAWAGLTSPEKAEYNKRAKLLHMTGYHLHQREWLSSH